MLGGSARRTTTFKDDANCCLECHYRDDVCWRLSFCHGFGTEKKTNLGEDKTLGK